MLYKGSYSSSSFDLFSYRHYLWRSHDPILSLYLTFVKKKKEIILFSFLKRWKNIFSFSSFIFHLKSCTFFFIFSFASSNPQNYPPTQIYIRLSIWFFPVWQSLLSLSYLMVVFNANLFQLFLHISCDI